MLYATFSGSKGKPDTTISEEESNFSDLVTDGCFSTMKKRTTLNACYV